ncbi:cytochrome P450 [Russula vinacea]|nr:cytochrome P450 [Russula vinacea]
MSFHVLGRVVVILGSTKATKDLLEKRGGIYSDRPTIPFFEIFQGEQLLAMTYGYEAKGHHDRTIDVAKKLSDLGSRASLPGSMLVNEFPFLRHIPEWMPRISYWPLARIGHALAEEVKNVPMQFLNGVARPSIAFHSLVEAEKLNEFERKEYERAITETLGTMYTVGTESVVSSIMSLFLAVLLYPEVQRKAQDEIDAVTERKRFPTFEDRPRLPFVDALCKEVMRWRPPAPLRTSYRCPHAASEDRVYEGLFIPKGAWLIGNIWAITHDQDVYPEPEVFNPERFLDPNGTLRDDVTLGSIFGFGKRVCPGRHFVDATMFIVAATTLSVFHIERQRDSEGAPFEFTYSGGLVSRPNPFPCSITPRDKRAEELILLTDRTEQ